MNNLDLANSYSKIKACLYSERSAMYTYQIQLNKLIQNQEDEFAISLEIEELKLKLDQQKEVVEKIEKEKEHLDNEIEKMAKNCNDIEFKVFYYHYVKQLTLHDCAIILHYSYAQIKRVNQNINKKNKR